MTAWPHDLQWSFPSRAYNSLARVGRKAFHVAALALGIERIKGQRGFAGTADPGYHCDSIQRDFEIKIFQIMLPGAFDPNRLCFHFLRTIRRLL